MLDPLAPGECRRTLPFELPEPSDEIASQPLLPDAIALEEPRDHGEDLTGVHRLDEVVVDLDADGLAKRAFIFALRHHDDGHGGIDAADFAEQLEPAFAGHLLVQEHHAVRLPAQEREGIVSVRRLLDGESLLFEEAAVPGEAFDFVIDPQDALGARHVGQS